MPQIDAPVDHLLAAYADAVRRKDADAFAALYHPEVVVFDAWNHWCTSGRAAMRAMAAGWFGSLGEERVEVAFDDLQVHADAQVAALSARATYAACAPDGTRLRAMHNRFSAVLRRQPDSGLVVHEHTSVPVAFGTGQAVKEPAPGA